MKQTAHSVTVEEGDQPKPDAFPEKDRFTIHASTVYP